MIKENLIMDMYNQKLDKSACSIISQALPPILSFNLVILLFPISHVTQLAIFGISFIIMTACAFMKRQSVMRIINLKTDSWAYDFCDLSINDSRPFYDEYYGRSFNNYKSYSEANYIQHSIGVFAVMAISVYFLFHYPDQKFLFIACIPAISIAFLFLSYILFTVSMLVNYATYLLVRRDPNRKAKHNLIKHNNIYNPHVSSWKQLRPVFLAVDYTNDALKVVNLLDKAKELRLLLDKTKKRLDLPDDRFIDEEVLLDDVVEVFIIDMIKLCKKSLSQQSGYKFCEDFADRLKEDINIHVPKYSSMIDQASEKLLNMDDNKAIKADHPLDLAIAGYVREAKHIHNRITRTAPNEHSKQYVISESLINKLMPDLISIWEKAQTQEQKNSVEFQFQKMIAFLEDQLNSISINPLENSNKSVRDDLLALEQDKPVSIDNLNQKIGINDRYLDMLQDKW